MEMIINKRTSDYIAEQLADAILSGEIAGNTPLRQGELAEQLGASRIPVREALQTLEQQGLAVRLATRHIVSAIYTEENIREIYSMIGDIEAKILRNIQKGSSKDAFLYALQNTVTNDELQMHQLIGQYAENIYLKHLLENAISYYIRYALTLKNGNDDFLRNAVSQMRDVEWKEKLEHYFEGLAKLVIERRGERNE